MHTLLDFQKLELDPLNAVYFLELLDPMESDRGLALVGNKFRKKVFPSARRTSKLFRSQYKFSSYQPKEDLINEQTQRDQISFLWLH